MATTTDLLLRNDHAAGDLLASAWANAVADDLEAVTAGYAEIDVSAASPITLSAAQYACPILVLLGALPANLSLIFPVLKRRWKIYNASSGSFSVTCKTGGTGVTVLQGGVRDIWSDGTNIVGAPHSIYGTIAIDPASIAANTTGVPTFTLQGALTTDVVLMNVPASFEAGLVFGGAFVSAANTVSVRLGNTTVGAIDGASRTWQYALWRY